MSNHQGVNTTQKKVVENQISPTMLDIVILWSSEFGQSAISSSTHVMVKGAVTSLLLTGAKYPKLCYFVTQELCAVDSVYCRVTVLCVKFQ